VGTTVVFEGKRYNEINFVLEEDFEKIVKNNFKALFGDKTIYLDLKTKTETQELGNGIPDGILFDFSDKDDVQFYLVEIELAKHSFYGHIFPQITRFFAFYRNLEGRNKLVESVFKFMENNLDIQKEFKLFSGSNEVYKKLKDIIETSQNILIVVDNELLVIEEIQATYAETWGRYVKIGILNVFENESKTILTLTPEFEQLRFGVIDEVGPNQNSEVYNEAFHLEDVKPEVNKVYYKIKEYMNNLDKSIIFNPQHYYISIRKNRNFAYIKPQTRKLKIVITLPIEEGKKLIKQHKIKELSEGVQNFYNTPCFEVSIEKDIDLEEIYTALKQAYERYKD
jgi:predicted transport protein